MLLEHYWFAESRGTNPIVRLTSWLTWTLLVRLASHVPSLTISKNSAIQAHNLLDYKG